MSFVSEQIVRFAHVDGAGIVFYPRYFEMLNAAVEDYFADAIGVGFAAMHLNRGVGVPTVKLEMEFVAASRLGDLLRFQIVVTHVGNSSATLAIEVRCRDELRLHGHVVIVCMDLVKGKSVRWPAEMRPVRDPDQHASASAAREAT